MREILALLPKPSRYLGIEEGACEVDLSKTELHTVLAFPDMYEVGMSYLGQKILYSLLNNHPKITAERVFTPCRDAAKIMREHGVPLAALESDTPLAKTHLIGFTITTELCFTNLLYMLDLADIPLHAEERGDDLFAYPIIMAGGGCTICAEPAAPFMDLMALGEGEVILPQLTKLLMQARHEKWTKTQFLEQARFIPGIYVPRFFTMNDDGTLTPKFSDYTKIKRRAVADLKHAPYPEKQVVPFGAVHNRLSLEIARGCTRGCRFCQAGMTLRPSRERNVEEIKTILNSCLDKTGFDDVSFLALSCGDFSMLKHLFLAAAQKCQEEQISISLPSLRVGSVDGDIMEAMAGIRRTGATLAPEAGSQRLRDVINKGITEEALIHHVRQLVGYGWQQVKLYFMLGLPTETYADLDAIVELCKKVRDCCRIRNEKGYYEGPRIAVTAALSPFVPKTHTPFQWEAQIPLEEMKKRIFYLRDQFKKQKALTMRWHEPAMSHLEGIISRGDRRLAPFIECAYKKGAVFDTWIEGFSLDPWYEAAKECHINIEKWIGARDISASLPWDHLEAGLSKEFLLKERERALQGKITHDCRYNPCRNCGTCDTKAGASLLHEQGDAPLHTVLNQNHRDQIEFGEIPAPKTGEKTEAPHIDDKLKQRSVRYRIWHKKMGQSAFLSQLEIQALFDRAMRRAKLPLAFSQGFHPMPLLTFGMALTTGIESEAEWFAITLREPMSKENLVKALSPHMLRGMEITAIEEMPLTGTIQNAVKETFLLGHTNYAKEKIWQDIEEFAQKNEIPYSKTNKKGILKTRNIRSVLVNYKKSEHPDFAAEMTLSWEEGYISPITFSQFILENSSGADLKLRKIQQHFA